MLIKIHETQSRRIRERERERTKSKVRGGRGNERLPFVLKYSYGSLVTVEYQLHRTVGGLLDVKVSYFCLICFLGMFQRMKAPM